MKSTTGIHVSETDGSLCLSWDNQTAPKKRFLASALIVFWIVWTPLTLFLTILTFEARGLHLVVCVIGLGIAWAGEVLLPYALLQRRWCESILVDRTAITLTFSGLLARKRRVMQLDAIEEISIGHKDGTDDRESIVTLNVMLSQGPFWSRREDGGVLAFGRTKSNRFSGNRSVRRHARPRGTHDSTRLTANWPGLRAACRFQTI